MEPDHDEQTGGVRSKSEVHGDNGPPDRLNSWKEIAAYFGRSVRCVQQWEAQAGLPVHRLAHDKKASVYAYRRELDAWMAGRAPHLETADPAAAERAGDSSRWKIALAAMAALAAVVMPAFILIRQPVRPDPNARPVRIRPLAVRAGNETMLTFSPDGTRVAYVWDGGRDDDTDYSTSIYVKQVDADPVFRLTTQTQLDGFPQWSPDGRLIAFYRPPQLLVIAAMGGRERKLGDVRWGRIGPVHAWTHDSSGVIATDLDPLGRQSPLWFFPLDMSGRIQITHPPAGAADLTPAMSPDGRTLAFTRNNASLANNIFLLPMSGSRPEGRARQLTFAEETTYFYLSWAHDSQSLYCLRGRPYPAIVRIRVAEDQPPEVVPQILPGVATFLAASPAGDSLAWSTVIYDLDLWRTEISPAGRSRQAVRIAHTVRQEQEPAISPDGSMLAFMSVRGGSNQLWLSDADGTDPTMIESRKSHNPSWSPDGSTIAYELFDRGGVDIYTMPSRGGTSHRVTSEPSQALRPVWSRDGRWIYFSSDRSGMRNIWKVDAQGGPTTRVTRNGGFRAAESVDRQMLYFTRESSDTYVWAMPAAGGEEKKLLGPLPSGDAFQVFEDGIYSIMKPSAAAGPRLVFYSFASGRLEEIRDVDSRFEGRMSVSADRRWLVYDAWRHRAGDLMMMEGLQ